MLRVLQLNLFDRRPLAELFTTPSPPGSPDPQMLLWRRKCGTVVSSYGLHLPKTRSLQETRYGSLSGCWRYSATTLAPTERGPPAALGAGRRPVPRWRRSERLRSRTFGRRPPEHVNGRSGTFGNSSSLRPSRRIWATLCRASRLRPAGGSPARLVGDTRSGAHRSFATRRWRRGSASSTTRCPVIRSRLERLCSDSRDPRRSPRTARCSRYGPRLLRPWFTAPLPFGTSRVPNPFLLFLPVFVEE